VRAVVARNKELILDTVDDPTPGPGQVVVKSLACGICGSDLHALHSLDRMRDAVIRSGFEDTPPPRMDPDQDMVFGHEFCAEIVELGPGTTGAHPVGSRVCSIPFVPDPPAGEAIGYSNALPGGFAEFMVLSEMMLVAVPDGVATEHAALTEPFAVGAHAVNTAHPGPEDVFVVIGCGPIGLSVIASLKAEGWGPVIAADFSAARRRLAESMGADVLIDPAEVSPYSQWKELGVPRTSMERMIVEMSGGTARRPVVFECVGVPGVLQQVIDGSPVGATVVVVGVCMEEDRIEPSVAINKQLDMHFVLAYTPDEFAGTLQRIAEDRITAAPIVTGHVGLDGVAEAFRALADPEEHCKILVQPWGP
jgi:threonine dehydrogenase-like Zn-dependent dehydrogenase